MAKLHDALLLQVPNRADVRRTLKSVIKGSATGIQTIYHYQAVDLKGESPVLRIMSASSERPPLTFKGRRSTFGVLLQLAVLSSDDDNNWTTENAEDTLDLIEAQLSQVLFKPQSWQGTAILTVNNNGPSIVRKDVIQGTTYLEELIPILVEVSDDGKK